MVQLKEIKQVKRYNLNNEKLGTLSNTQIRNRYKTGVCRYRCKIYCILVRILK